MNGVELVAVGTELLLGDLVDTNTSEVARTLAQSGIDVYATHAVGDNRARIANALRAALSRSDGVIVTGGLGPTKDDLTKEAVCDVLGVRAEMYEPAVRAMERRFASRGRTMRDNNRRQALLPAGSIVLENDHGTAPGFIAQQNGKFIAALPGVPAEMRKMLAQRLMPWLQDRYGASGAIYTRVLHTVDLAESEIDHRIGDLFDGENPKVAVLAHDYRVDVKLCAKAPSRTHAEAMLAPLEAEIEGRLRGHVYGRDAQTLPDAIGQLLRQREKSVALAESCTGGSIAAALTSVPGSSKSFVGGVVAYSDEVKVRQLAVDAGLLQRHGAVSQEVAVAMAQGARNHLSASMALSTTGVAGPDGGSAEKPVGLVWFGFAGDSGVDSLRLQLGGERREIVAAATTLALGWLWRRLQE